MALIRFRRLMQCGFLLTVCLFQTACGGSAAEGGADLPVAEQPPVPPPSGSGQVSPGQMVAFGYAQLASGSALQANRVQNRAVSNATANYRFPRSGESISGNLTLAVDVADPDGIARVLVGFNGSERALVLCTATCGSAFSQTVTGVNPRNFGVTPGSLRLELWLDDQLGNRVLFDARDIEWLPQAVEGVSTSRSGTNLDVSWTANTNARRYNLYIAEQPGITPENVLSKTGGRQFLALSQNSFSVPQTEASKRYFLLVTGVDSSGESLFSEQHLVQPVGAPEFSAPVARPDQFSLNEDEELRGSLFGNDSHPDGRSFFLDSQPVRSPDNGSVTLDPDGSFVYKGATDFSGTDSFIYQITDDKGLVAQAEVSLTVLAVNDIPLALDDSYNLTANTGLSVDSPGVLVNDLDLDSALLQVRQVTAPAHGQLQLSQDGAFSYTPEQDYSGEDSFVYQVTDEQGGAAQARVTLRIELPNAAPVARNDSYQTLEDQVLVVNAAGILLNDDDPDGDKMQLVPELLTSVQNGELILSSDGSFRYLPRQDFFGSDSFSYQIKDSGGLISQASVALTVLPQNDPPVLQDQAYSANPGVTLSIAAPGLLAHAMDVDDTELRLLTTPLSAPTKGSVSLAADGSFSYTSGPTENGTDSFSVRVTDAAGETGSATVVINLITDAQAPVLEDAALQIFDDNPEGYELTQLFAIDPDLNDTTSFSIISGNELGLFNLTTQGLLTVADATRMAEQAGTVQSLVIQVQDSYGLVDQAILQIEIFAGSVIANPDQYTVDQDSILSVLPGVLANDLESSGAELTASLITGPANGQLSLNANGSFVYIPTAAFFGSDSFTYQASNGSASDQAVVELTVRRVITNVQANPDSFSVNEDNLLTVTSANSLLQNDNLQSNQSATVSLVQGPAHGTLNLNPDGTFSYQPAANYSGNDSFIYRLSQNGRSDEAQVTLSILPVNDAPALMDASVTISDDYVDMQSVATLTVVDPDPGSYQFEIISGNTGDVFSVTSAGQIKVANAAALNAGTTPGYSLMVRITEDNDSSLTDTAQLTITVTAALTGDVTEVKADYSFAAGTELSLQLMLSGEYNNPVSVIPLSDGKSLILGTVHSTADRELFVVRLKADGSIDTTYADDGLFRNRILSNTTEDAVAAVLTSGNQLVVLANYSDNSGSGFVLFRLSSSGVLDPTFGNGTGYVLCEATPCGGDAQATDLIQNHLGHYVVSGVRNGNEGFLLEFADSGYQNGWISNVAAIEQFDQVLQDSSNKYYGIGQSANGHIVVARFFSDFTKDDPGFGPGYYEYDFGLQSSIPYDAVLYDDYLYVVGSLTDGANPGSPDGLFFKLDSNGLVDSTFGNGGFFQVNGDNDKPLSYKAVSYDASGFYVFTATTSAAEDMLSLSKYSLSGAFETDQPLSFDGELTAVELVSAGADLWLLAQMKDPAYGDVSDVAFNWVGKYQSFNLSATTSFSADGQRWFNAGFGTDVLQGTQRLIFNDQTDKTLFYGYSYSFVNGSYQQGFIGRLAEDGALDQTFGNHGVVLLRDEQLSEMTIKAVLEAADNKIYVAGYGVDSSDHEIGYSLRLDQHGDLDPTFATGVLELTPAALGTYDQSAAVQLRLTSAGQLLVGAEYRFSSPNNVDISLLRLNTDGTVDSSFGNAGFALFSALDDSSTTAENLDIMELDPDDNIVIAGQYKLASDPQLFVARYTDDGVLMNSNNSPSHAFGTAGLGYSLINLNANSVYYEKMNSFAFDSTGHLIFAMSQGFEGDDSYYLYRLEPDGLADTSFNSAQPRLYSSFSNSVAIDLVIKQILLDGSGRLLMAGTYGANAWIGRVLLDGSGSAPGRWDPNFEYSSGTAGAHVFTGFGFTSNLTMELAGDKLLLGWSKFFSPKYKLAFRQYRLDEYDPNNQ